MRTRNPQYDTREELAMDLESPSKEVMAPRKPHTLGCYKREAQAFYNHKPDPGCTCDRDREDEQC